MKASVAHTIIAVLSLAACTKAPVFHSEKEAVVQIRTTIASSAQSSTKGIIRGRTTFPDKETYGIFICESGTTDIPHKSNAWNIRAQYNNSEWGYYYVSNLSNGETSETPYSNVTLTAKEDSHGNSIAADLYAYAPYIQGAYADTAGPEAIPYTINECLFFQEDLMYASQNAATQTGTPGSNANLDPESGNSLTANFTFHHAFALLEFQFTLRNANGTDYDGGTRLAYNYVTVNLQDLESDGTTAKLYSSGTFNIITGEFENGVPTESLRVKQVRDEDMPLYVNSSVTPTSAYMVLVPTEVDDNELIFTFTFNNQDLRPFVLQASQLVNSAFESGYKYTFHFTIDDYVYLDRIVTVQEWTNEDLGEQPI